MPGGDGYRVRGYFDSLGPEHRLFELKTSARRPSVADLELRPQLGIYRAAYEETRCLRTLGRENEIQSVSCFPTDRSHWLPNNTPRH